MVELTQEAFTNLLWRSNTAVERALVVLEERDAIEEEDREVFAPMLRNLRNNKPLTPQQLSVCRNTVDSGHMRIAKYIDVLLKAAVQKQHDLLCLEYTDVVDSDSVELIKPVVDKLRAFEKKYNLEPYHIAGSVYDEVVEE